MRAKGFKNLRSFFLIIVVRKTFPNFEFFRKLFSPHLSDTFLLFFLDFFFIKNKNVYIVLRAGKLTDRRTNFLYFHKQQD
jgi:hypothetical protein